MHISDRRTINRLSDTNFSALGAEQVGRMMVANRKWMESYDRQGRVKRVDRSSVGYVTSLWYLVSLVLLRPHRLVSQCSSCHWYF